MYGKIIIEIPKTCRECQFFGYKPYGYDCLACTEYSKDRSEWLRNNYAAGRPTGCPIKPLDKDEVTEAYWIPSQKCTVCTWEEVAYVDGYECSECGHFEEEKEPYCNCGCKMTEVVSR